MTRENLIPEKVEMKDYVGGESAVRKEAFSLAEFIHGGIDNHAPPSWTK
jgi:hypothetical protein